MSHTTHYSNLSNIKFTKIPFEESFSINTPQKRSKIKIFGVYFVYLIVIVFSLSVLSSIDENSKGSNRAVSIQKFELSFMKKRGDYEEHGKLYARSGLQVLGETETNDVKTDQPIESTLLKFFDRIFLPKIFFEKQFFKSN